jgi:hypothetical protein
MLFVVNIILVIVNLLLVTNLEWNPLANYVSNLLLICHLVTSGTKLPGAMADFNRKIVEVVTLNLREIPVHSEYATISQLDHHKYGLRYVGYQFISTSSNFGLTLFVLCVVTKIFLVSSNILLFFVKTENRCGPLRLRMRYVRLLENISTRSYFHFEMSSAIIQLTCAFVYLRFSKTYYTQMISATRILDNDMFVAIISLVSTVYLCIHLMATAHSQGWWGLHERLIERRGWYARRHRTLMNYPLEVLGKKASDIRVDLNDLEKEFTTEEDRAGELRKTVGRIQSEGIYPSVDGFKRPLLSILLKIIIPVAFAAILVFVDTN